MYDECGARMKRRDITLSLPEEVLRKAEALAQRSGVSTSILLAEALCEFVERERQYTAEERSLVALGRTFDLGTGGEVRWSREELHERADV